MPPSQAKTRLLLLRPTLGQGGADRVTLTLLQNLPRDRFDITLGLTRMEGAFLDDVPDYVRVVPLGARSLRFLWWPLACFLRRERFDIVFSTSSGMNPILVLASAIARSRARLVLSERNMLWREGAWNALGLRAKQALYGRADAVTTVSSGVRQDVLARVPIAPGKVRVVYNPVVTESLARQAEAPLDHPWFHAERSVPVVLAAGRFVPQKGFDVLLRSFATVLRSGREARLVVLGEGPLRSELETLVSELGLSDAVSMPGFDKNPFRYMARADVFALSSRFEGLPGVLIQAMACGAPPVATACPSGPEEIISDPGGNGLLVPVDDPEALAGAISRLLDASPRERAEMGARAREAVKRFTVEAVLRNYEAAVLGEPDPVAVAEFEPPVALRPEVGSA